MCGHRESPRCTNSHRDIQTQVYTYAYISKTHRYACMHMKTHSHIHTYPHGNRNRGADEIQPFILTPLVLNCPSGMFLTAGQPYQSYLDLLLVID